MAETRTLPTPLSLEDFDLGVTLGTGSFGRVRFVTHKVSNAPCLAVIVVRAYHLTTSPLPHPHFPHFYLGNGILLGSEDA